ncbi:DUF934 domain-containing protein [Moraxella sp. Tifton1]|uniref:DUF934 domain-containing protein n=1 Tax=Moraxella oculi TaxID=2940516 RepID=UPI00201399B1|nr:DUF934 domain-containing protein [Moraxella sp. Tifton1]MCL1623467.1 DUF934 domain-containing protein [Moraxella sp. Tifton1]
MTMYLVEFKNQKIKQEIVNLSLLTNKLDELAESLMTQFLANEHAEDTLDLALLDEFDKLASRTKNILLTADNTTDEIDELLKKPIDKAVFFVKDFKDGRTFSLIRYLINKGFDKEIYLLGNYGLDQANYYLKSGATGFFVKDEQLDTLLKTLSDLKSGHFGQSAKALPMFQ